MSISTSLRNYQREAIEMAKKSNTLVVLPTGSGKTQISAAVIQHHIIAIATSSTLGRRRALFLTPTVLLVRQQANVLRDELKDHKVLIAEYIGGKAPPPPLFHVLVTTPGAFLNVIDTARHFELGDYAHITFDEVHHMTGDHPYTSIAGYLYSIQDIAPPVLGLTASLTYAQSSLQIHKRIQEMCAVLRVSKENIYYTTENTLRHDGFHAVKAGVTKIIPPASSIESIPAGDHEAQEVFIQYILRKDPAIHPVTLAFWKAMRDLETTVQLQNEFYETPLELRLRVQNWANHAHTEANQVRSLATKPLLLLLAHLYEAVALVANSKQEFLELAITYLEVMDVFEQDRKNGNRLKRLHQVYETHRNNDFTRLAHLKNTLQQQHAIYGDSLHALIFVRLRISTHIIMEYILRDDDLKKICRPGVIYSPHTSATNVLTVTNSSNKRALEQFRTRELNMIIATSVAEEGIDVEAANCVIRFDGVDNAVSFVQSRGRARQEQSSFLVMDDALSNRVERLQFAENTHMSIIANVSPPTTNVPVARMVLARTWAARTPYKGSKILTSYIMQRQHPPQYYLQQYAVDKSYSVREEFIPHATISGHFTAKVQLKDPTNIVLYEAERTALGKKAAREWACEDVLQQLIDSME